MCFIAGFAMNFGHSGVLGSSKCVGFVGPVVDFHARWFAAYLEGMYLVGSGSGSTESIAVKRSLSGGRR